jgi:hypothetical protein
MPITWIPGVGWAYKPEIAITSRWTQSNSPSNAVWTKNGYTVPGTTTPSPLSGLDAYLISETATTATHEVSRTQSVTAGSIYCLHGVVKMQGRQYIALTFKTINGAFGGETVVFDAVNKSVFSNTSNIAAGIYDRGDFVEVFAVVLGSGTATGTMAIVGCDDSGIPSTTASYAGDTSKGFWWFNLQQCSARTLPPVIVTTTGTVTLSTDVLTIPTSGISRFNQNNISVVADYYLIPYLANSVATIYAMAGDASNLAQIYLNMANGNMLTQSTSSGVSVFATTQSSLGSDTVATGFVNGSSRIGLDGSVVRGNPGGKLSQFSTLYIGCGRASSAQFTHGLRTLSIYKQALSLQRIAEIGRKHS